MTLMGIKRKFTALMCAILVGVGGAVAVSSPAHAANLGPFYIVNSWSGLCMEIPGTSYDYGVTAQVNYCSGAYNQLFTLTEVPEGGATYYYIRPVYNNYCLTIWNASWDPGAPIQQWGCQYHNATQMVWIGYPGGVDRTFHWHYNGLCMVTINQTYPGAPVFQDYCNFNSGQIWRLQLY